MAHAQKPHFVFRRNGRVHLNRRGRQFSRLLRAEVCASAAVMLDTPCSEVVWSVLATHSIRQFPLHFPYRASPCAITFQLESSTEYLSVYTTCRVNGFDCTGLFEMTVGVLTTATSYSRFNPMWFLSMGLRQRSGLCSSSSRKYPGTEGTNQNHLWNHHRWHATNSL